MGLGLITVQCIYCLEAAVAMTQPLDLETYISPPCKLFFYTFIFKTEAFGTT